MFEFLNKKMNDKIKNLSKKITEKKIESKDLKNIRDDLERTLLEGDVALEVSEKIFEQLEKELIGKKMKRKNLEKKIKVIIKKTLLDILNQDEIDLIKKIKNSEKPFVIVFLGFNGSGKTTTIAKVAYYLKKKKITSVFSASDTFRAAAIQQLEEHGKNLGIRTIRHDYGSDPAAVTFDAIAHAKSKNLDVVLVDTAGRSHININLMDELEKICRVNKPDLKILVIDSLTGNDAVNQAENFNTIGVDAVILTKMDVNKKSGVALSVTYSIQKPIIFIGTGQNYNDLKNFSPEKIISSIID